jgi:AcrR family transcriptional regulator
VKQQSTSDRYQDLRKRAIRSAAAVFAEKGFHGSSTRDIAERLGIKQGSLYYYFKSKEEALGEVCLFGIEDYVNRMQDIAARTSSRLPVAVPSTRGSTPAASGGLSTMMMP